MRESFVFHADFIEHLPKSYQDEWALYVVRYGLTGQEPAFNDPLHSELWRKIRVRIDSDEESYRSKVEYIEDYNLYKKALKSKKIDKELSFDEFRQSEVFKTLKDFKSFKSFKNFENFENISTYTQRVSDSVSDSDNVSVSEYEYENVYVSDGAEAPTSLTPSQTELSKQIMLLMKDAHLPCARGNEISFLQRDFNNAMGFLHKTPQYKSLHSDEIISAVKNYIEVIQDTTCYYKKKMDLFTLVQSKQFWSFLPGNFDITNFRSFDAQKKTVHEEAPEIDYSHAGEIIEVDNG